MAFCDEINTLPISCQPEHLRLAAVFLWQKKGFSIEMKLVMYYTDIIPNNI